MSFLAYMNKLAILNFNCNYEFYSYEVNSFDLFTDMINDAVTSRELLIIEAELLKYYA